jgi:exopolysaccharide biosynthesis polyprenyl glycosylphosphotransferase
MTNFAHVSLGTKCVGMGVFLSGAGYWVTADGGHLVRTATLGGAAFLTVVWVVTLAIRKGGWFSERVLLLGASPLSTKLGEEISLRPDRRYRLVGVVDDRVTAAEHPGLAPWVGTAADLRQVIEATRPDRIVLTMADRRGRLPEAVLLESRFEGVSVEEGGEFFERVSGKLAIEALRPSALILARGFRHLRLTRWNIARACFRAVECLGAAAGLAVLSPVLTLMALAIKIDSRGPVFFVQQRVGRGGRSFSLLKFRTMREAKGKSSEWIRDNEARVTRVGRWLRRFRLDEVPQLWNVLRGDMSFVGPRPHPMSNYPLFLREIPYYSLREHVRPGITGWAQVRYGYANDLEEETEKMRYDIYYIKHRTVWLDIRILVETILLLVFDRQSHQASRRRHPIDTWSGSRKAVPLG